MATGSRQAGAGVGVGAAAAGDVREAGQSEVDRVTPLGEAVELGEFLLGRGKADRESVGFTGPALAPGLVDAGCQVVADAGQSWPLGRVDAQ